MWNHNVWFHPPVSPMCSSRPQIILYQKTCSHIAVCLPETIIEASHMPLHSVLSSLSLPHYSSSIFKRGYALLQLVGLEANLLCSLQWSLPVPIFLLSPYSSQSFCICLGFLTYMSLQLSKACKHKRTFCTYFWSMWQRKWREESNLFFLIIQVTKKLWSDLICCD